MTTANSQASSLALERTAIVKSGRLHWFHWAVVILSLGLTALAWQLSRQQVDQKAADQFGRAADQMLELVAERMRKYELGLRAGVSAIQAHGGDIDRNSWKVFADNLRIDAEYPGINGIGVIHHIQPASLENYLAEQRLLMLDYRIHPAHTEAEFLPITYIEPASENVAAIGLDIAHEANRYGAALKARDSGEAQITSPIVLVQDAEKAPGFLFYAPFYAGGDPDTLEGRRDRFTGMVYAPFVFHKLIEGLLDKEKRQVRIKVQDRDADAVLYDELGQTDADTDPSPMFRVQRTLSLYGKTWVFDVVSTTSFADAADSAQPTVILISGLVIEILLLALFIALTRANRRAVDFADRMTATLKERSDELEKSNAELEKFAYVTSHDLKTPLRGISDLTEYLEEDLEPYLDGKEVNPDVPRNLERLRQQTRRMDGLIRGILDYSSIGTVAPKAGCVDSASVLLALRDDLGLADHQMRLEGEFPEITTDVVRFQQVMTNLVGNALKYHHEPERATVTVRVNEKDGLHLFSVADDGPGIDPSFHDRIFDVFQTLKTKDDVESTGIGLSIVKKAVESHGGRVTLTSDVGKGAIFTFEWPKGDGRQHLMRAA